MVRCVHVGLKNVREMQRLALIGISLGDLTHGLSVNTMNRRLTSLKLSPSFIFSIFYEDTFYA